MKLTGAFLMVAESYRPRPQNRKRMRSGWPPELTPIYRVTVTERTAKAINYQHRSGATKIDFRGTALMPNAHGEAKVESKQGYIEIEVEFRDLPDGHTDSAPNT